MKKSVLICTKVYNVEGDGKWLIDDLVEELDSRRYNVIVLFLDISGKQSKKIFDVAGKNVKVVVFPWKKVRGNGPAKSAFQLISAWCFFLNQSRKLNVDYFVNITYLSLFAPVHLLFALKRNGPRIISIIWDFYPVHFAATGKIRSRVLERVAYWLENKLVSLSGTIAYISEGYRIYGRNYFSYSESKSELILGLWRTTGDEDNRHVDGGSDRYKARKLVFGGQLSPGRGLDRLLDIAKTLRSDTELQIIGDGELKGHLTKRIADEAICNVSLIGLLGRDDYMAALEGVSLGLVIIDTCETVSFPSKSIDYMLTRTPILAAVEERSDFGEWVQYTASCGESVSNVDSSVIASMIESMLDDPVRLQRYGANGRSYFLSNMQTSHVCDKLGMI